MTQSSSFLWFFLFVCMVSIQAQESIATKWQVFIGDGMPHTIVENEKKSPWTTAILRANPNALSHITHLTVLRRLDRSHFVVSFPEEQWNTLSTNFPLVEANNRWKLSENLLKDSSAGPSSFVVKSASPEDTMAVLKEVNSIVVKGVYGNHIQLYGNKEDILASLLPRSEIQFIGNESFVPHLESTVLDLNPSINSIPKFQGELEDTFGEDLVISLKDNQFFANDIDLIDKLVPSPLASATVDGHATDMATIMAGLGNSSIKGKGIAPSAKISLSNFENIFPDDSQNLSQNGIFVQNHSYGTQIENFYGILAEAYDLQAYNNPTELHIFSAGNAGEQIPADGPYSGLGSYANLTGNFKMAKNILTVGAVDEEYQRMSFSSRGPAFDGRVKPELVAYSIIGTSNATALTSAVVGLLQEYYQQSFNMVPPASLIKAMLLGSADDIGPKGPDFDTGYGNLNADKALKIQKEGTFLVDSAFASTPKTYRISIPEGATNIKITLVWTDLPANANDGKALVNDLDLSVSTPDQTYLPWVLDSSPFITALGAEAERGMDHLNTIEQVTIPSSESGQLDILVNPFDLQSPHQEFAIAYSWDAATSFEWKYPLEGDNLPYDGETPTYLRWNSTLAAQNGSLSVSYDDGITWETITDDVPLEQGYFLWTPPEDVNTPALLKISDGTQEYLSDPFFISRINQVSVGLNCDDTLELQWKPSLAAEAYSVYSLTGNRLQAIAQVTDTTYVVQNRQDSSSYFAIRPLFANGASGVRSETLDTSDFPVNCYSSFLFAEADQNNTAIELQAVLSSIFNVSSITVEKKQGDTFTTIAETNAPSSLQLQFTDDVPQEGSNTYRLKTTLTDGSVLLSEETQAIFLSETAFISFPNPIANGINIISKDTESVVAQLEIYGLDGRFILSKPIDPGQNFILLEQLPSGLYAMVLLSSNGDRYTKLVQKL